MANATTNGIVYPTSGDSIAPLETVFANLAQSADDAIATVASRSVQTYADTAERDADTTASEGKICYVLSNNNFYFYDGTTWQNFGATNIDGSAITSGTINLLRMPQITNDYVADGTLTGAKFVPGTLSDGILDGSITNAKLASGIDASKVTTGTMSGDRISGGSLTADAATITSVTLTGTDNNITGLTAQVTVDSIVANSIYTSGSALDIFSGRNIRISTADPTTEGNVGDIWIKYA